VIKEEKKNRVGEVNQGYSEIGGGSATKKKKLYHQSFSTTLV